VKRAAFVAFAIVAAAVLALPCYIANAVGRQR